LPFVAELNGYAQNDPDYYADPKTQVWDRYCLEKIEPGIDIVLRV